MRAECRVCKKSIVVVEENSSIGRQWRLREHGPVNQRCYGSNFRYFLHELDLAAVKEK
jgi:hypothetical protein